MNRKILKALLLILIALTGVITIYYSKEKDTDAMRFKKEYPVVSEDNVFIYKTGKEIINILKHGTGVVYLGFPECSWCQEYVKHIDKIAKETELEKIYYFNILKDRKENTELYKEIVEILHGNLLYDNEGNERVYVPDLTIVKEGKIIFHNNEGSLVTKEDGTPTEFWNEERVKRLKDGFCCAVSEITKKVCNECSI